MGCGQTRVASPEYEEDDDYDPRYGEPTEAEYMRRYGAHDNPAAGPGGHMMHPGPGGPGHMMYPEQGYLPGGYPPAGPPSAMAFTTAPPHLNFDPLSANGSRGGPMQYEPPNSAARFFGKNQVILDEEMLEEYIRLERMIQTMERGRILQRLQTKVDELRTNDEEVKELEHRHESLLHHVDHKKQPPSDDGGIRQHHSHSRDYKEDVDWLTQTYAVGRGEKLQKHIDSKMNKNNNPEQDMQFALDIVTKELDKRQKKLKTLTREVDDLNMQAAHLLDLYLRLDEHLANLFSSSSTNEKLRNLEEQLAAGEEHKTRLEVANAKWQESQMLLEFACRQLAVAVQHWKDLPTVPSINVEVRYDIDPNKPPNAHKVKKKIQGVESQYDPSKFPFANPEDLRKFNQVPVQMYAEMLEPLGLMKDHQKTFSDTYMRAMILLQWFDQVLNSSMRRDLTEVSAEVRRTAQALRRERLLLARKKVQQVHGRDVDMDSGMDSENDDDMLMRSGFQNLFMDNTPMQAGRAHYPLEAAPMKYNPYENDKYDLRGDLDKMEARSQSARARAQQGLDNALQRRRMRRGKASGHLALVSAVSTLRKLN